MPKSKQGGPEYSREREFKVILEQIETQFRTFGEGMDGVRHRLTQIEDHASRIPFIEADVATIKSAFRPFTQQVSEHENQLLRHGKRLAALEKAG